MKRKIAFVSTFVLILFATFGSFSIAYAQADVATDNKSKDATQTTKDFNAQVLESLPFANKQDFEDPNRGFIAPLPNDGAIANENGDVIWNLSEWDFIEEGSPAPDTVNPSLWRQAKLLKISGLFKVTDGIYQVRGADLANITLSVGRANVEGDQAAVEDFIDLLDIFDPYYNLVTP